MPFPFPCSPVIREWLWKKTQIEKKKKNKNKNKNLGRLVLGWYWMILNKETVYPKFDSHFYKQFFYR